MATREPEPNQETPEDDLVPEGVLVRDKWLLRIKAVGNLGLGMAALIGVLYILHSVLEDAAGDRAKLFEQQSELIKLLGEKTPL